MKVRDWSSQKIKGVLPEVDLMNHFWRLGTIHELEDEKEYHQEMSECCVGKI